MTEPVLVACGGNVLQDPQALLASAPDAYIAIDVAGHVVAWNPAAESTFGHRHADACGRDLAELIIPQRYRAAHRAGLALLAAGGSGRRLGQRLQLEAVHADGHEFPIELTLSATAGPVFHAFCHDVTAARRISRFAGVEASVSRGLAEASSSQAAATRVVEALGVKMDWPVTELWLADDERQVLACAARHAAPGRTLGNFALDELPPGAGLPGRVYARARSLWIADLAADAGSLRSRAAARIGLHVAVGVPICTGSRAIGALCVYGDRVEDPEESLTALLTGIAAQVGQYLERRRAEELAIELARTKDEFLALVTHELRNPLAVITATASLLEEELDGLLDADQRQYVRTVLKGAERLSVMAGDLLDLAHLESGHLAIHPAPADLAAIIGGAVQAVAAQAAGKNLTIIVDTPEHLELYADGSRLQQVADNLLSNAIKYTPADGTITITATADDLDDGQGRITWTVTDTGIGIPAADRPHLFRRFYRASTALDRRIPGTGLGLVITRAIIERHGGTIALASHDRPGTTFRISLPTKTVLAP
ncbi:PAS domain-containing sensor histidine kinase [Actinoplanes sp. NPDC023801]|uniref:PAS domain-containing sensor histidine kinase n=1 Tax=Actinoplanes sp. NPDC023801 TaxID=3154595 RepID=UPI0033E709DA